MNTSKVKFNIVIEIDIKFLMLDKFYFMKSLKKTKERFYQI